MHLFPSDTTTHVFVSPPLGVDRRSLSSDGRRQLRRRDVGAVRQRQKDQVKLEWELRRSGLNLKAIVILDGM